MGIHMMENAENRVGGVLSLDQPKRKLIQDMGLIRRAVQKKWPITQENMNSALSRLMDVLDQSVDDAVTVAAVRTLSALVQQNVVLESVASEQPAVFEVTSENLEQRREELRRRLIARSGNSDDSRADSSG